jgi:hypothetical protein
MSPAEMLQAALTESYDRAPIILDDDVRQLIRQLTEQADIPVPAGVNATLRPYQERGYSWMYRNSRIGFGSIIADDMGRFRVLSEEERKKSPLIFNFRHFVSNPKHIEYNKGDSRLLFLQPEGYNRLLSDYRKFKESLTK